MGAEEYAQALDELVRRGLVRDLGGRYALSPRVRGAIRMPGGGGIALVRG